MLFNHNITRSKRIFFDSGNQRKYITGGWETLVQSKYDESAVAEIAETIYLEGSYCATTSSSGTTTHTYNTARANTVKAIDVTNLNEICFAVEKVTTPKSTSTYNVINGECVVGVADAAGLVSVANEMHNLTAAYTEVTGKGIVTVDVSELTGEYFIYASATGGYYSPKTGANMGTKYEIEPYLEISKIWGK